MDGRAKVHNDAIISIRPFFAEAILSGSKSIELRRRIPPMAVGTRLWIYATKPVGAIIGSVTIAKILRGTPEAIWHSSGHEAAIDRTAFDAYFEGTESAVGIVLIGAERCDPVSIDALRAMRTGFHPPQVIARITEEEATSLKALSAAVR